MTEPGPAPEFTPPPVSAPQPPQPAEPLRVTALAAQLGPGAAGEVPDVYMPLRRGPLVHLQIGPKILSRVTGIEIEWPQPVHDDVVLSSSAPVRPPLDPPPVMKVTLSLPLARDQSSYNYLEQRYDLDPGDLREAFTRVLVNNAELDPPEPAESIAGLLVDAMGRFLGGGVPEARPAAAPPAPTDRQALDALLARFGLVADPVPNRPGDDPGQEVTLTADVGGVEGYHGFYAAFRFDADGKFGGVGIFE